MSDPTPAHRLRHFTWTSVLSVALAIGLLGALIHAADIWYFLANTRLIDPLIGAGVIKYHDQNHGFIEGIPDLQFYVMSQDPVRWDLVVLVVAIFLVFFFVKAAHFHGLTRLFGLSGDFGKSTRAFLFGELADTVLPQGAGDAATALALQGQGAPIERAKAVVFGQRVGIAFQIVVFGVVALLLSGWTTWFAQIFWAVFILTVAWLVVRAVRPGDPGVHLGEAWAKTGQSLRLASNRPLQAAWVAFLGLLAFGMEDIAAYVLAMGFSSANVLLHVDPTALLTAIVASYIARFVRVTPGGIGQFEWGFAAALWLGGVAFHECVTIAILDNVFRYLAFGIFYAVAQWRRGVPTTLRQVIDAMARGQAPEPPDPEPVAVAEDAPAEVPSLALARIQPLARLCWRLLVAGLVFVALFLVDRLSLLLFDYWLLDSLDYSSVFWTNFRMGAALFVFGFLTMGPGIAIPAFVHRMSGEVKRLAVGLAVLAGLLGGYFLSTTYADFLFSTGVPFGQLDPVFDNDVGFYVYTLPALWLAWRALIAGAIVALVAAVGFAYLAEIRTVHEVEGLTRLKALLGAVGSKGTLIPLGWVGLLAAVGEWLTRYGLLFKDNKDAAVYVGAAYVDVVGLFTHLNTIWITTAVILGLVVVAILYLSTLNRVVAGAPPKGWEPRLRLLRNVALALIALDFAFIAAVTVRDWVAVRPNAPVIQLPWIEQHVDATRRAYHLDDFELVDFVPQMDGDPVPDVDALLASPTLVNAPLWPGYSAYLERYLDPQHAERVLQTGGDTMVYGPTKEVFRQQQKLRTYYDFMGVDTVRYTVDGERCMFVSAVRELPLHEPYPWLSWFGQRFMLFTHGWDLVMAPAAEVDAEGAPIYATYNIPAQTEHPELVVDNPRVYYGEGAITMAYSNVEHIEEFDYPTEQDRAVMYLPDDVDAGIRVDSLLKRLVLGWRSDQFLEVVFSDLITDNTRVHYFRSPLERLERVAPFLYYDTNPYAVTIDGEITWMVNALTTSDRYPFSLYQDLGDKSDERASFPRPDRRVNYVEDAIKATVDAYTGQVAFYQVGDGPVATTWASIYPGVFTPGEQMPDGVRAQLTYPLQLFHVQFDDVYNIYHMVEPMYFFNMEDQWDDGDEVLGPILANGKSITFSIEAFPFLLDTRQDGLPTAAEPVQFALGMVFTPEKSLNLRAIPLVYQDGEDYGRVVVLQVPKGTYYLGPEQADAAIDQDPEITEQMSWWNRLGTDVIRGHTTTLVVDGEVIYVEPLFIRSQQNPVTQLKRVVVVFRGVARMGESLDEALRLAVEAYQASQPVSADVGEPVDPAPVVPEAGEPGEVDAG